MKKIDLTKFNYEDNKRQIFDKIIDHIEIGIAKKHSQIYIKKLQIVDEEVDVIAVREDWPICINKALDFYKNAEHYESCAKCQSLLDQLSSKTKKTKSNGRKSS